MIWKFQNEILQGFSQEQKTLPPKFKYDLRGSELFEEITKQPEYYLTRAEIEILESSAQEIASPPGEKPLLIEYGSGNCKKTKILLNALTDLALYIPIDISEKFLLATVQELKSSYPNLLITPLAADYTQPITIPPLNSIQTGRWLAFFPGSSIGNIELQEGKKLLLQIAATIRTGDSLLIGADRKKDPAVLRAAYHDKAGATETFNMNILDRMNKEAPATFDRGEFQHWAEYNSDKGRVEIGIQSLEDQIVEVAGNQIHFRKDEVFFTEFSYKFSPLEFIQFVSAAGFEFIKLWSDQKDYFSIYLFRKKWKGSIPLTPNIG